MEPTGDYPIRTRDLVGQLDRHPLYARVCTADDLRVFMHHHVFCVWDFMTLLKTLQRSLTCVEVPWLPTADPLARRLLNEIVLEEESDADGRGGYLSHFELYLAAMQDCGADTGPIQRFLSALRDGLPVPEALTHTAVPDGVCEFVRGTLAFATAGRPHEVCAAFAYGREDVIPNMFRQLVARLATQDPHRFDRFGYYLERHIHADGEKHGPLARQLTARLYGADPVKSREAEAAARQALAARLRLWDCIVERLGEGGHDRS